MIIGPNPANYFLARYHAHYVIWHITFAWKSRICHNYKCQIQPFNPLTAGAAYIRVFIFFKRIKYHILNKLKIKCDINQQDLKIIDLQFVKSEFLSTHLKLWIASARHNFKWVRIQIE